ncbi:MAG: hypothetical protein AB6733_16200 [Clostridiaceae bacterium]
MSKKENEIQDPLMEIVNNPELVSNMWESAIGDVSKLFKKLAAEDPEDMEVMKTLSLLEVLNGDWEKEFLCHEPNVDAGKSNDEFCKKRIEDDGSTSLSEVKDKIILLGEHSEEKSKGMLDNLQKWGCSNIYLIDCEEDEEYFGCNGIVVELPKDSNDRRETLLYTGQIAQLMGFEGEFDDGQQFTYIGF